jgi:hypothetical protein
MNKNLIGFNNLICLKKKEGARQRGGSVEVKNLAAVEDGAG